ncbi:(S)-1-Phenylethanol dehydrogenase [Hyella patelloides LEGE 07179]|uniref:(S)-1-Phenylethanol dehydrogenase n=1 Tax=Hyella patelloides LEGE 07179 TaxID=945734 RepID=A0A563VNM6_9CYAN|nr:SDR family NAD(P)-dependent oxidoreductase [Hyella patelloides]VEP12885.1 (S)-1-Phenylethanol dehydrogenase [Hyella patelloides LEGE 07179]
MNQRHAGKVAVVTGASKGLGQSFALRLANEGADLVLVSRSPATKTQQMVHDLGSKAVVQSCDLTSETDIETLANVVQEKFGRCDILVNNAGIYPFQPFEQMSFADWRKIFAVNLDALFFTCKAFLPLMKPQNWGRIINITSNVCWIVAPNVTHYTTAKMGVIGFTRALATEVADAGIIVNAIAPGLIRTETTEHGEQAGMFEMVKQMQAIHRTGEPEDVAAVVSFLASEDSSFMTGQTLMVDGGMSRL